MSFPATIAGFTVFPTTYGSSSTHVLYVRTHVTKPNAHSPDNGQLPHGRTLFIVNLPPDATEREVILFFKQYGTVEQVLFDFYGPSTTDEHESDSSSEDEKEENEEEENDAPRRKRRKIRDDGKPKVVPLPAPIVLRTLRKTGRSAHLIFLDSSSVSRCLSSNSTSAQKPRPWPVSTEPTGLAHYLARYSSLRPPLDAVRTHADTYMTVFEAELAKSRVGTGGKYKKGEAIVDDDGFTLVVRGGAYGQTVGGGVAVASKRFQASAGKITSGRKRKDKSAETKDGFYAFQKAEKQRSDLMNLRKNWEADKAKVEKLKQSRRFKPY